MRIVSRSWALVCPFVALFLPLTASAFEYQVIDLGGYFGGINRISADGHRIVGTVQDSGGVHAVIWQDRVMRDVGLLPGYTSSFGVGMVATCDEVVGYGVSGSTARPFVAFGADPPTPLAVLGGPFTLASDVNSSGFIVGYSALPGGPPNTYHGVLWLSGASGGVEDLHSMVSLGGSVSRIFSINTGGDLAGSATLPGDAATHAFLFSQGVLTDLGTLPGDDRSDAISVNDSQHVVGNSMTALGFRGFLYDGVIHPLGTLGGNSSALHITNDDYVLGASTTAGGALHGVVWSPGPTINDINTLIDPSSGWVIDTAFDRDAAGEILARGSLNGGSLRSVLLIRTP